MPVGVISSVTKSGWLASGEPWAADIAAGELPGKGGLLQRVVLTGSLLPATTVTQAIAERVPRTAVKAALPGRSALAVGGSVAEMATESPVMLHWAPRNGLPSSPLRLKERVSFTNMVENVGLMRRGKDDSLPGSCAWLKPASRRLTVNPKVVATALRRPIRTRPTITQRN